MENESRGSRTPLRWSRTKQRIIIMDFLNIFSKLLDVIVIFIFISILIKLAKQLFKNNE